MSRSLGRVWRWDVRMEGFNVEDIGLKYEGRQYINRKPGFNTLLPSLHPS